MGGGIGDLTATMGMDSTAFTGGLHEGARGLHEFKDVFLEVAGVLGVGLGLEGVVEAVKGQMEQIVDLSHMATRTGIEVNDLQALKLEAKECGIQFETLQRGMTKLSVTMETAADGGQEELKLFKDLKLDATELAGKLPIDQFLETADAISKIEDPTKRTFEAYKIFGRSGAELLEVLERGKGGFSEARQQLEEMGMAITPEQIAEMKEAHESIIKLETATAGLGRAFAEVLAPGITKVVDKLSEIIKADGQVLGLTKLAEKKLTRADGSVVEKQPGADFEGFTSAEQILAARAQGFQRDGYNSKSLYANPDKPANQAGFADPREIAAKLDRERNEMDRAFDEMEERGAKFHESLKTPLQKAVEEFTELRDMYEEGIPTVGTRDVLAAFAKIGEEQDRLKEKEQETRDKLNKPYEEWTKNMEDRAKSITEQTLTPLEKLKKGQAELQDLHDKHFLGDAAFDRSMKSARDEFNKATTQPRSSGPLAGLTADSREFQQQMVDAMRESPGKDGPQREMVEALKVIAKNTEKPPGWGKHVEPEGVVLSMSGSNMDT
jgi:hypothetical protein